MDIRLLGPLEVSADDGSPLVVRGPLQRSVLAALALRADRTVPEDELIRQVWGAAPPAEPGHALRRHIRALRELLPPGRLPEVPDGHLLRISREETDLGRFRAALVRAREVAAASPEEAVRRLDEALELWRGTPLGRLGSTALRDHELPRLADLRLTALEERAELRLSLGRHEELLPELITLVRDHPLRVRLAGQLVQALHRGGRVSDAAAELSLAHQRLGDAAAELRLVEAGLRAEDAMLPTGLAERLDRLATSPEMSGRLAASVFPLLGIADVRQYSSGAVSALAGCTPREASQALERLTAAGLARGPVAGLYALGTEERAVASRQAAALPEARRRAHLAGLARWYLGSLYRVNSPLSLQERHRRRYQDGADRFPHGRLFTSAEESLGWADHARQEVLALAHQLSAPEYDDGGDPLAGRPLSDFALEVLHAMESYFRIRLTWRVQRRMAEIALRVAQRRTDVHAEAVALAQLGRVHSQRREPARGVEVLERAVELFRSVGDEEEALYALSAVVPCLGTAGRLDEAVKLSEAALEQARGAGLDELSITIRHNLGRCHLLLGNLARAHRMLTEGYAMAARVPYFRAYGAGALAEYHLATEDWEQAVHWSERALGHAAEQPFDPFMVAKQRTRRATALRGLGREQEARVEDMQAQALLEDLNRREESLLRVTPVGEEPFDPDAASVQV
ncbi:BTAD domain-containing putative transcriptional regulator [Streptomyces spiramenti]|uniref:Tetratricopeptide repeat protein n=1 Tax=Streptomyces spiramenti TaxID=2720606 RepID=A0ABX1AN19_9ACTN|nr:BTAD domain-containing putative transcriptional regulator [Streptomyces spiramenti]NJP65742.1 tetratricopeptide repeat protein [Streptomyces spiramenti]